MLTEMQTRRNHQSKLPDSSDSSQEWRSQKALTVQSMVNSVDSYQNMSPSNRFRRELPLGPPSQPCRLQPPSCPCESQQATEKPGLRESLPKFRIHPLATWVENCTQPRYPIHAPKKCCCEDRVCSGIFGNRAMGIVQSSQR